MNEDFFEVVWLSESLTDRGDIYEFLYEFSSEEVAEKNDTEILRATSNLSVSPFMGVKKPGRQGLQLILTSVPYIVSYSFDETAKIIKVLRILPQKAIKNYN